VYFRRELFVHLVGVLGEEAVGRFAGAARHAERLLQNVLGYLNVRHAVKNSDNITTR